MTSSDPPSSPFSLIKQKKIPDLVYRQLVSLITSGHFKPGQRLPSERDMAQRLGVSRQSFREALNRAKVEGLIGSKQGGGTFVISTLKENHITSRENLVRATT